MSTCRICDHNNRSGAKYCEKCGAELLSQGDEPASAKGQSSAAHPEAQGELPEGIEAELLAVLESGRKIEAIKLYRERTGAGLKEAKDAVEALARQHNIGASSSGCAGAALTLTLLSVAAAVLLAYGAR